MKNPLLSITAPLVGFALGLQGQIYFEDFSTPPTLVSGGDGTIFYTTGPQTPTFSLGEWSGSSLATWEVSGGVMDVALPSSFGSRSRGMGILVASPTVNTTDTYRVTFDVTNFSNPNAVDGDGIQFNYYEFSNVDDAVVDSPYYIAIDQSQNSSIQVPQTIITRDLSDDSNVGFATNKIGEISVTGDGTFSEDFQFTFEGNGSTYFYLNWTLFSTSSESVSTQGPSFTLDNVSVTVVPEPGSAGLVVGLSSFAGLILLRRRRRS
ncbi:MAG: PEP-CTERM sorting domain-containing protein [Verrucomicrobiota bacterium]